MGRFEGHTPGPWRRDGWAIVDSSGVVVCRMQPWDASGCRIDDNADAELIAAAPDLLAERKILVNLIQRLYDYAPSAFECFPEFNHALGEAGELLQKERVSSLVE